MRLLHFDHFGRLASTDFYGKPAPPYAILSHRWEESEILFEDIASGTYKKKKDGYRKLAFCAKQAAKDQLQYFWIDTCCIKRWDKLERSRAINSMFRWYSNAAKCYVFLSGVSVPTAIDTLQRRDWEISFRTSDWFKRGWTLQELIAPTSVEFFTYEGQWLGNKSSLEQLVHEITNIPLAVLRNLPLDQFTQRERMHWADDRRTTEEEDIVYCLLGIVGVTMQVNYGEGRDKAWRRLKSEVEATSSTPSIIPFSRNEHFVGRESQLAALETKLFSNDYTATRLAIVGPSGTGKSQLALELAYLVREKIKTCSVFWVDASSIDSLDRSYDSIAQRLNIPGWDNEKADAKQLVKLRLEEESGIQCLLIFDNIENISLGASGLSAARAADLTAYLPKSKQCSVVFTTTESSLAKRTASHAILELQELTPDAAKEMFVNYLNRDEDLSSSEEQQARLLLQELSHLPLAIVQAAAYINVTAIPLQDYRSQLNAPNEHDVKQGGELSRDRLQGWSAKNPIATTLFISLDEIRRSHTLAADCLFLAACVAYKDIPFELFEDKNPRGGENAVQVLSRYALVTRRPEDSALDVHRRVHHALRDWLQQQGRLSQQSEDALEQLLRIFPDNSHQNRSKWRRLLPHTKYALSFRSAEVESDCRSALTWRYAMTLRSDGRYNEAEELFVQVMETRKGVLGDEHPDTLASMENLASTYRNQGRWKAAEGLSVQVLETRKRVLGDEHPDTLTSIAHLALTYMNQGRWKEAEELEVQVVEMSSRVLGEEHPNTLASIADLASTYRNQGRWKEAEELSVQVMETSSRVLGEEHPETLAKMAHLASTYMNQGRWTEAEEQFVRVMETSSRVLGEEHPDTLASMTNLASTYRNQGRWTEAEELFVQVIETSSRVLGKEHPDTLASMTNLASTYMNQGRWKETEDLFVQVMETSSRVLGEEHPNTLASMNNLALTLKSQNRDEEALSLLEKCHHLSELVLGESHPDTKLSVAILNEWRAEHSKANQ
jgi:tetratricopeptide (TPR) repeat protein